MKTEIKRFCPVLAVALALVGAAFAEGEPAWGYVQFEGGATVPLTKVNASGEAVLEDADLTGDTPPVAIQFTNTLGQSALPVGGIKLSDGKVAFGGTVPLQADGTNSAFCLTGGDWTFKGLTFKGAGETAKAVYDGGAIDCEGGTLTLEGCTFTNLVTRFTGGAVSARKLTDDMLVTNCTFVGNKSHPINGYGGALYASAATGADVRLDVVDCRFAENMAENGGAICTLVISSNDEDPVTLAITDGPGKTTFEKNAAIYEGGAVFAEGPVWIEGSNTLFEANWAGFGGGAVCLTGVQGFFTPVTLTVTNGVVFADNETSTNVTWTAGGAIAVMPEGCKLEVYRAVFTNNCAKSGPVNGPSFGGAVYTGDGVTNLFWKTAFVDNEASAGNLWCYGGAISVAGGETTVDTCVFDYGTRTNAKCYGNAIDCNEAEVLLLNSTFRRGQVEAVSAYNGSLAVTNCVAVGNGISANDIDFYVEGDTRFTMAYSAYGAIACEESVNFDSSFNLGGRTTEIYDGDSLRLDGSGFNPVAGLGLVQPGVRDFVETEYGSCAWGSSMGAYETNTVKLALNVYGTREYDGTPKTNDTSFVFSIVTATNDLTAASYPDLVPTTAADKSAHLKTCFAFTDPEWTYGPAAEKGSAGHYDSTNATSSAWYLTAAVAPVGATNAWLATLLDYRYQGDITPSRNVAVILTPDDYPWNNGNPYTPGTAVEPVMPVNGELRALDGSNITVVVSNKVTGEIINPTVSVTYADNTEPSLGDKNLGTGGKYILKILDGDFEGTVITNYFSITAYITEYYKNEAMEPTAIRNTAGWETCFQNVTTNGWIAGSNAWAVVSVPDGFCLDWQNSVTNKTVALYGMDEDTTDNLTRLVVIYEKDVVGGTDPSDSQYPGDGVPDKFQKRVLFATVNGNWKDTENGRDIVKWVTLTNTAAKWAVDGNYNMTEDDCVSVTKFFNRYTEGGWNTNPQTAVIGSGSFPVFFYAPNSVESPGSGDGRDPGEGGKPTHPTFKSLLAAAPVQSTPSVRISETLAITDFTIGGEHAYAGRVVADVVNADSNVSLLSAAIPLDRYAIEVLGCANLGDEWVKVAEATTDENGFWFVDRLRTPTQRTTLAARPSRDGEGTRAQSDDVWEPQFFKLQLKSE